MNYGKSVNVPFLVYSSNIKFLFHPGMKLLTILLVSVFSAEIARSEPTHEIKKDHALTMSVIHRALSRWCIYRGTLLLLSVSEMLNDAQKSKKDPDRIDSARINASSKIAKDYADIVIKHCSFFLENKF